MSGDQQQDSVAALPWLRNSIYRANTQTYVYLFFLDLEQGSVGRQLSNAMVKSQGVKTAFQAVWGRPKGGALNPWRIFSVARDTLKLPSVIVASGELLSPQS